MERRRRRPPPAGAVNGTPASPSAPCGSSEWSPEPARTARTIELMSDARSADAEHLLALVARGVQRMADSFGALERTLAAMPATRPVWVDELVERIALVERRVGAQGELVTRLHEA